MVESKDASPDERIQTIYEEFMNCISSKEGKSKNYPDCLKNIVSKLTSINVGKNSILEKKIETLVSLVSKKEQFGSESDSSPEQRGDYSGALNELGVRFVEKPKKKFADVKGMDEVKRLLQINVVYPIKFQDLSREFGIQLNGGILLYGPPGNGKTLLAEALAGEAGINFLELNPAFLFNEYFGRFEKNISEIFRLARETAPNLMFFDEVETLMPKRENADQDIIRRGVSQLLIEINKMMSDGFGGTYLIAATNLPWDIDMAMLRPGRFNLKIYVPLPSRADRLEIIKGELKSSFYENDIDIEILADETENYSAADLKYIFRLAIEMVFYEAVQSGVKRHIRQTDLIAAAKRVRPSTHVDLVKRYERFSNS